MGNTNYIYPRDYINFMGSLRVDPENTVIQNVLDEKSPYISTYYTPNKQVSELGMKVHNEITSQRIRVTSQKAATPSLTNYVLYGNILKDYPELKPLFQIVFLESFAIIYIQDENIGFAEYANKEDLEKVRETIKYIIDVLGLDPRYSGAILYLHDLDKLFGETIKYLPILKGGRGY